MTLKTKNQDPNTKGTQRVNVGRGAETSGLMRVDRHGEAIGWCLRFVAYLDFGSWCLELLACSLLALKKLHHRLRERREVEGRAAGDEVAIDDGRFINPDAASVLQIVLDAARAGDATSLENLRGDGNPATVTDEGDELALLKELTRERKHLRIAPQLVRHEAAGNQQPGEVRTAGVIEQQVGLRGVTMLAGERAQFLRGETRGVTRLFEPQLRIPEFEVFVDVIHEREQRLLHGGD